MDMTMTNEIIMVQRITILEQDVKQLKAEIEEIKDTNKKIVEKLDELLELRSKGMGVFWILSGLFGTGLIGAVYAWFGR